MKLLKEINKLSDEDKLNLISEIWESLDENRKSDLTPAQKAELDRRLQLVEEGKMKYYTWEEVKARLKRLRDEIQH
ncbi:MAG: addiction module protein [Chitinophagales bacterium]|nr:addiction module protein [Chitinophagales bacterium]